MRPMLLGLAALLLLPTALAVPVLPGLHAQPGAADDRPAQTQVSIQLNLTGTATQTNGGPNDGFTAFLNVTGTGTRTAPANGNGVQVRADGLTAQVTIVRTSDNVVVENYTALVGFHAQEAQGIAQGLPAGSFKFNLELRGDRASVIVGDANADERVLAMNADGTTTGAPDGSGTFAMDAQGHATMQRDGTGTGATHFNLQLDGDGSTGEIQ